MSKPENTSMPIDSNGRAIQVLSATLQVTKSTVTGTSQEVVLPTLVNGDKAAVVEISSNVDMYVNWGSSTGVTATPTTQFVRAGMVVYGTRIEDIKTSDGLWTHMAVIAESDTGVMTVTALN